MAGSVMPKKAEREAGKATDLFFRFLVLMAKASAAAPWATLAAVAMGIQVFTLVAESSPASKALYM